MKKLLIILFLLIISLATFSQQYYPLIEEERTWNVMNVVPIWGPPIDSSYYTVSYLISGDSILNNTEYKKLYSSNEEIPINWNLNGFIREDSVRRVWYMRVVDTCEVLLYDFSLQAGDSIKLGIDTTFYYKVDSITTEIVSDSLRKKYWISQDDFSWKETWIEGVGSNKGIIGSAMASAVGGWTWLLCMSDEGDLIYMNPNYEFCYLITDLTEKNKPIVKIYPNPATNVINCVLPDNEDYEIIIYNALSSNVTSSGVEKAFGNGVCTLNISRLPPGIYFVEARGEKILRGRFVKE